MTRKPPSRRNQRTPERTTGPAGYDPETGIPRYLLARPGASGSALVNGAILGAAIAILPSYFAAEAALETFAHPVHWLGAVGATALGAIVGAGTAWLRGRRPG